MIKILRIEIDGHFRGSRDVPKPWVAQIDGVDATYGLARTFVQQLRDYRGARRACSGNLYGVVAAFPLHEGRMYEVSRLRGRASKRHLAREFLLVDGGKRRQIDPIEALAIAEAHAGPTLEYIVPDGTRVARVDGLGSPTICGFVIVDGDRLYRLRVGAVHEVDTGVDRHLIVAGEHRAKRITQTDALARLSEAA